MKKPVIVKTEEQEINDDFAGGFFGLFIVAGCIAASYVVTGNITISIVVGICAFIATCFSPYFRLGYLALTVGGTIIVAMVGVVGLIIWAIVKFSSAS